MTEVFFTISPWSLWPKFACSPITRSPMWKTQLRRPPRGQGRDLPRRWWTPPWRRRYQRSGPNTASFKQKSFRLDLSSPQEEPLSPRESSTKKSPKEKGINSEKSSIEGKPTQKIDFSIMSSTKYGSPKVVADGKRASLSTATSSKSLERNRTPHKSSSAKSRDFLRTPAALSTKSEATRTPLSGRSKQTPRTISTYRTSVESTRTSISSACLCQAQRTRDPQSCLGHGVHPLTAEIRNWKFFPAFSQHAPWRLKKNM